MNTPKIFRRQDMLTVAQFAKILGIGRRTAYTLVERGVSEGGVLAFRFGEKKGLRIPVEEVERYKAESQLVER